MKRFLFDTIPPRGASFGAIVTDQGAGADWYRLWVGDAEGRNGDFVDTSPFNDAGSGWIRAGNLDQVEAEPFQGAEEVWVQGWSAQEGASGWAHATVRFPNTAPVVEAAPLAVEAAKAVPLSEAELAVADPDHDAVERFQLWDANPGGSRFRVDGEVQPANQAIDVPSDGLETVTVVGGEAGSQDTLWTRAHDGEAWGEWTDFEVTVPEGGRPAFSAATLPELEVTFDDSTGAYASAHSAIETTAQAAWRMIATTFDPEAVAASATLDLEVGFAIDPEGDTLMRSGTHWQTPPQVGTSDGRPVAYPNPVHEIRTGTDRNGDAADASSVLETPLSQIAFRDDRDEPLPDDQYDGLTLFAHELLHALGWSSTRDAAGVPGGQSLNTYDRYVSGDSQSGWVFEGPMAQARNGEALPLGNTDPSHLPGATWPGHGDELMGPSLARGEERSLTEAEVAILGDMGLPVTQSSLDDYFA